MRFSIPNAVLGPVCLVLGVLAVVWAVLAYRSERRFEKTAQRATGVVQELIPERIQRTVMYFPVIRFTTAAGVIVSVKSKSGRSGGYQVGQSIRVLYDPADPSNAEIDAPWSRWLIVIAASLVATILFSIGAAALLSK